MVDMFRVFSNPLHDYPFRLEKVYNRYLKLEKYYYNPPLKPKYCGLRNISPVLIKIRNYLYDEFVFDPGIEVGKEHGKAFSIRLVYTPLFSKNHLLTLYSSLVYVGTPTFRHGIGTNNFVQNGRPLGWHRGSDGQELCIGMNYFNNKDLILNISTGLLQRGEETITNRIYEPYADYLRGPFPSGQVEKTYYIGTNIIYWFKENLGLK